MMAKSWELSKHMAIDKTYKIQALVLRKTKLGERDLIVTMLASSGELVRGVAKGARKPGSAMAARLELFNVVDVMLAKGRNLDVVTDVRLAADGAHNAYGLEQAACASAIAELLAAVCQEGLSQPRLFDLTRVALGALAEQGSDQYAQITAAALVKIVSSVGFRPSLLECQACGTPIDLDVAGARVPFSVSEGGATCASCSRESECFFVEAQTLAWAHALLFTRFADIPSLEMDVTSAFGVLSLMKSWIEFHVGRSMKSMNYLFASGLF